MRKLKRLYRKSPVARLVLRAAASGAAGYVADVLRTGTPLSLSALGLAGATAAGYAILGVLTPTEPFVGKKARVEVPVPPADPEVA